MKFTEPIFLLLIPWKEPLLVQMADPLVVVFRVSRVQLSSLFRNKAEAAAVGTSGNKVPCRPSLGCSGYCGPKFQGTMEISIIKCSER